MFTSITSTFHAYIELGTTQMDEEGLIINKKITPKGKVAFVEPWYSTSFGKYEISASFDV